MTEHTATTDLTALLPQWQLSLRAENKSPGTIEVYTDGSRRYLRWCETTDHAPMARVSLRTWMAQMLDAATFEMRTFAPGVGVAEDPVCGSMNASVGQWLTSAGAAPSTYKVEEPARTAVMTRRRFDADEHRAAHPSRWEPFRCRETSHSDVLSQDTAPATNVMSQDIPDSRTQ
jgi:hypothetical protein